VFTNIQVRTSAIIVLSRDTGVNPGEPRLTEVRMNRCQGSIPVATKVDQPMREFVEAEADRLGITVSEFLRRLLLVYRESQAENTPCEHCGQPVSIELSY